MSVGDILGNVWVHGSGRHTRAHTHTHKYTRSYIDALYRENVSGFGSPKRVLGDDGEPTEEKVVPESRKPGLVRLSLLQFRYGVLFSPTTRRQVVGDTTGGVTSVSYLYTIYFLTWIISIVVTKE